MSHSISSTTANFGARRFDFGDTDETIAQSNVVGDYNGCRFVRINYPRRRSRKIRHNRR